MNTAYTFSQSQRLIFAVFCSLGIFCSTFSAANPVIKISPDKFTVGITKSLIVECSFNKSQVQTFANIYSLLMLHASEKSGHDFKLLVSVNSDGHLQNNPSLDNSFTASGVINSNSVSYIKTIWQNPTQGVEGMYKCEASGVDSIGRPISLSSTAKVETTSPNLGMAVAEIHITRKKLDELQLDVSIPESNLKGQKRSFFSVNARIARLEAQLSVLKNQQVKTKNNLERAKESMFLSSPFYNHRRYWLTRYSSFFNPGYAQSTCQIYGGYLAEFDTYGEYIFVKDFVTRYGSSYYAVMLGGTDEGHEGLWINRQSKTRVASFWHPRQPDNYNGKENCLCLWRKFNFAQNDCPCLLLSNEVAFVCEIPE